MMSMADAVSTAPADWRALSADEIATVRQLVGHTIAVVERELVRETLVRHSGNRTHAARVLGISIRGLRNKIREYQALGTTGGPEWPPTA
jgi:DNA-binding NtrC family response regulator